MRSDHQALARYRGFHIVFGVTEGIMTDFELPELVVCSTGPDSVFIRTGPVSGITKVQVLQLVETPPESVEQELVSGDWYVVDEAVTGGGATFCLMSPDGAIMPAGEGELAYPQLRRDVVVRVKVRGYVQDTLNWAEGNVPEEYEIALYPCPPGYVPQHAGSNVWKDHGQD